MIAQAATTSTFAQGVRAQADYVASLGTHHYPPKVRRRLKSVNVGAFTVAVSCLLFALTYAHEDAILYRDAILINLGLMLIALTTPAFHRINEIAGPIFITLSFLIGLFMLVALVGRLSGIQINFIAASAALFLVFDLKRLWLIASLIAFAIALHIACWVFFQSAAVPGPVDPDFLLRLYITVVVTISIIVAVLTYYAFWTAERAEEETETLLHLILPASVAERLKSRPGERIADSFDNAAVLFADLVGFVALARSLGAHRTVAMLNDLVSRFDRLAAEHGVAKIKTIGDAYMAVAGVPNSTRGDEARLARMALLMQAAADETAARFGLLLQMRIGIASGPLMAGVIGSERFTYDVWGDPVNLAARLENSGEPGKIHVSEAFRDALAEEFVFTPRGERTIKGVGVEETFFLVAETAGPAGN